MDATLRRTLSAFALVASLIGFTPSRAAASAPECAGELGPRELTEAFAAGIGGIAGADYQRTIALPDGRVLWVLQDAFLNRPGGSPVLVHNVGLLQDGSCFTLLRDGSEARPEPWIGASSTRVRQHWFWPLGGAVGNDGLLRIFVAELDEPGAHYLSHAQPIATWMATIDLGELRVVALEPATDSSAALYGWAIASDETSTYLFAHCYRQFGFRMLGHDSCAAEVTVARVPFGELGAIPTYWNGSDWDSNPDAASNIAPALGPDGERRAINPSQFAYVGGSWIAVTKEGDWWGSKVYLDRAPAPYGPWTTSVVLDALPLGDASIFNTYFASFISVSARAVIIGLSNNRWDGALSPSYRPTFEVVATAAWLCRIDEPCATDAMPGPGGGLFQMRT